MTFFTLICLVFATAFFGGRLPAAGWWWDLMNGIGFAAMGALVYLGWASNLSGGRPVQRLHSNIAIVAATLVVIHAVGFLILDSYVWEYLKLKAPLYMLAGLVGFGVIVFLAAASFPPTRRTIFRRFAHFRIWHLGLSIAAVAFGVWHIVGSGFYLDNPFSAMVFLIVALAVPGVGYVRRRRRDASGSPISIASVGSADRLGFLALSVAVVLGVAFSAIRNI